MAPSSLSTRTEELDLGSCPAIGCLAGEALDHALAPGRFALETEDGAPDKVAAKMQAIGGTIAHGPFKLQPHGEEVVIVQVGCLFLTPITISTNRHVPILWTRI